MRKFIQLVSTAAIYFLAFAIPVVKSGEKTKPIRLKITHVYKTVGDVKIHADVYRVNDKKLRPCLVWIHGGALINGSRRSVPRRLLNLAKEEDYVLISLDYRLAPEVKLPEIIDDIKDAFTWIDTYGKKSLGVDTNRIVVSGGSAGGYLTMMTGFCVKPRPKALVAYWGYGDVDGDWYTKPSKFYRTQTPLIDKAEALKAVHKGVLTESFGDISRGRGRYYRYLRQNGLWTKVVSGFDPKKEPRKLDPYCPVRNIDKHYPPIFMLHGTKDNDVPYEQSLNMAKELKRQNLPHVLISVPNAGHGLFGGDPKLATSGHEQALAFIRNHLK